MSGQLESKIIYIANCRDCPVSYLHPYDEELECNLSPTEQFGVNGVKNTVSCTVIGTPINCPLRNEQVLLLHKDDDK